ncbi:hypothetical protein C5167_030650 [Papaver somniferum]|nr:hypothetical protein C5167_030650 [Papaver somniferum]
MLENPNDSTIPVSASVKRYAPPNQRNRGLSRRKSGDKIVAFLKIYQWK